MDRMGSPYSTNKVSPMEDSGGRRGNYYVAEDGTDLEFKGLLCINFYIAV